MPHPHRLAVRVRYGDATARRVPDRAARRVPAPAAHAVV